MLLDVAPRRDNLNARGKARNGRVRPVRDANFCISVRRYGLPEALALVWLDNEDRTIRDLCQGSSPET